LLRVTHLGLRASDDDRQRIIAELERHTAAGRLTLDEFSDRGGLVYNAATHADLARVTHDLPATVPAVPAPPSDRGHLLAAFLLATITIVLLGIALALWKH
jgi:DUF1707 SHOCT-like domain